MGERRVWYYLNEDETLQCSSCSKYSHDQKVYLYLDVDDSLDEVMCRYCWKKNQMETNK